MQQLEQDDKNYFQNFKWDYSPQFSNKFKIEGKVISNTKKYAYKICPFLPLPSCSTTKFLIHSYGSEKDINQNISLGIIQQQSKNSSPCGGYKCYQSLSFLTHKHFQNGIVHIFGYTEEQYVPSKFIKQQKVMNVKVDFQQRKISFSKTSYNWEYLLPQTFKLGKTYLFVTLGPQAKVQVVQQQAQQLCCEYKYEYEKTNNKMNKQRYKS